LVVLFELSFTFIIPEQGLCSPLVPWTSSHILTLGWFY